MRIIKIAQGRPYEIIEKELSYPFGDREPPAGRPISSLRGEDRNICIRSADKVKSLLAKMNLPYPRAISLSQNPSYLDPSGQTCNPYPSFVLVFSFHYPEYIYPSGSYSPFLRDKFFLEF